MTILKMSWRNLWRNKRRTIITTAAVALGLTAVIFADSFNRATNYHVVQTIIGNGFGDVVVHGQGFRESGEAGITIPESSKTLKWVTKTENVASAAPRMRTNGIIAIGDRSASVTVLGIDTDREKKLTVYHEKLIEGNYLNKPNDLMIGRNLAEDLEIDLGSKIVMMVADAQTGEITSILLRVAGILFTNNAAIDRNTAIIHLTTAQKILGLQGKYHEIGVKAVNPDLDPINKLNAQKVAKALKRPGLEVFGWWDLSTAMDEMLNLMVLFSFITLAIVFFLVSFGIINTLSMSLLERFREFGILRAIGSSPGRLGSLIFAEAFSIGVLGAAIGLILTLVLYYVLSQTGIDMGNTTYEGVTYETKLKPILSISNVYIFTIMFLILTPLVAFGPAFRAAKVDVIRALRHE